MALSFQQINLLIIDDNLSNLKFLESIFSKEGYVVHHAKNTAQALRAIKTHIPDIIFLDVVIPGMNGNEFINLLRANEQYANIPIIMMTSLDDIQSKTKALEIEADDYLIRPFNHSEVLLRTRNLLRIKSSHDHAVQIDVLLKNIDPITELMSADAAEHALSYMLYETDYVSLLMVQLLGLDKVTSVLGIENTNTAIKILADKIVSYGILIKNSMVSHLGQGKFIFILPDFKRFQLNELCTKLKASLLEPIKLNSDEVYIKATIGAATYPSDGKNARALIYCAEIALINSNEHIEVTYYDDEMQSSSERNLKLEAELHHAIENNELEQCYQPIVDLKSKKIVGIEALLRWKKNGCYIPPAQFIPMVEEIGLMPAFHLWSINSIEAALTQWSAITHPFHVSINISPKLFFSTNFSNKLIELSATHANKVRIAIEVTEGCLIEDMKRGVEILTMLNKKGIQTTIDDFGTGFSSFSYLKNLPATTIKIDKSFIDELASNKKSHAIVHSIIQLAKNIGMTVVAEGVESQTQLDILTQLDCDSIQGFILYQPMLGDEFYQVYLENTDAKA